ncbi:hypothetical protein IW261DRAFT_985332 [Armillaria novae-zelandiae]|uniref:Uncharacterized protein n=1 Tax=Armillaria novae-zelandiae TaxID=153914 RepID=A0AA39UC59_9AGAR|nr:hypothetical protein IW261DRAFT_985332 [Armillaria novae-zelandiae]
MPSNNHTHKVITALSQSTIHSHTRMLFQIKLTAVALAAMFLFVGQANAIAANPVDACNGSNNYSDGHSCAFQQSQGICRINSCGVLVCVPN